MSTPEGPEFGLSGLTPLLLSFTPNITSPLFNLIVDLGNIWLNVREVIYNLELPSVWYNTEVSVKSSSLVLNIILSPLSKNNVTSLLLMKDSGLT